jgi:hypothetical protein
MTAILAPAGAWSLAELRPLVEEHHEVWLARTAGRLRDGGAPRAALPPARRRRERAAAGSNRDEACRQTLTAAGLLLGALAVEAQSGPALPPPAPTACPRRREILAAVG